MSIKEIMIERIIEFSARNKGLVILCFGFLLGFAFWSVKNIPLDALPDLSDTQVIIYSRWEKSPDIIEDQVTYPIISSLLGAPHVKTIRGFSDFGFSYVYVIFEDGTDLYWARSRVLEYLSKIIPSLPEGVQTEMGPDATSIGWVYQYALVDRSGQQNTADLKSLQDFLLRYQLQSVPGVAEVASIGGHTKQYQVNLNPDALASLNIPLMHVAEAIKKSNNDTGGRLIELSGKEYMVRSHGYLGSVEDIENIVIGNNPKSGDPILIKQVATVEIGPDIRRGVGDLDGLGDTVSGIVIMRHGENALAVIKRVKERLEDLKKSLPSGVEIVPVYDRSDLILRAIDTLKRTLIDEIVIVSLVIILFLWHVPSAITAAFTIPISVLLAFIPLYFLGISSNLMTLAGIAISIGVLVDGAIVEVENIYHKTQLWIQGGKKGDITSIRINAIKEVGPSAFFSLLVVGVSFIPIFTLVDQEGRLFKPLAYSKNLAMFIAAVLALTLNPAMRMLFSRVEPFSFRWPKLNSLLNTTLVGRYYEETKHPISRVLFKFYEPICRWALNHKKKTLGFALALLVSTIPVFFMLGSEFMPPLNEGSILYMPTTLPGISITEAERILQIQDRILKTFPEVERVYGKVGRANTSTDPAPFSMVETIVVLKPENEWRKVKRWYSWMPEIFQAYYRHLWNDKITWEELINEMNEKIQIPGWTNAWTMPIKNRIDMLATGIRTPIGIKVLGDNPKTIESIGIELEKLLTPIKGSRGIFAERTSGGYFVDFDLNRSALARYGLTVDDANAIIATALGGENLTTTIEGRKRFPVNLRYARSFRDDLTALNRVLVSLPSGGQIPINSIADIHLTTGPSMIRDENGQLSGYVYVDIAGRDIGSYVNEAKKIVSQKLTLPSGYVLQWSGQYENMIRVKERLRFILPLTLFIIFMLLYLNTKSFEKAGLVMLAVPFSLIGAIWFLFLLDYNLSIAVWVGMIALMGLDAETGIFMLLFLDLSYKEFQETGKLKTTADLKEAIVHGAVMRVRPKMMTVCAAFMGLLPILWSMGTGSDLMKRIAAPMIGGLLTSFLLELLVYPVIYLHLKEKKLNQ